MQYGEGRLRIVNGLKMSSIVVNMVVWVPFLELARRTARRSDVRRGKERVFRRIKVREGCCDRRG